MEAAALTAYEAQARALNLSNATAQRHLDISAQMNVARSDVLLARTQAHPEIGGEKLPAATTHALRVLDQFLPASEPEGAEFRQVMNELGVGNWPPILLLLARVGKSLGEDGGLGNRPTGGGPRDPASVLWPEKT